MIGAGLRPAELPGRLDDLGGGAGLLLAGLWGFSIIDDVLSLIAVEAMTEVNTVSTEEVDKVLLWEWKRGGSVFWGFATSSSSKRYRKSKPNSCSS